MTDEYLDSTIAAYNKNARVYSDRPHQVYHINSLDWLTSQLEPNSKVLELGCGGGRDTHYLHEKGLEVVGTDFSEGLISIAKSKYPDCQYKKMDMRNIEFPSSHFNAVLAWASMLHLKPEDLTRTLKEVYRVLLSGGILVATFKIGTKTGLMESKSMPGEKRYFTHYQKHELLEKFNQVGFDLIEYEQLKSKSGQKWHIIKVKKIF